MAAYLSDVSLLLADSKILLLKRPKVDSLHPRLLLEDSHQGGGKAKTASNSAYITSLAVCGANEKGVQDKVF